MIRRAITVAAMLVAWHASAEASVVNGGFETGDFSGWSVAGSCTAVGSTNPVCQPLDSDPGPHSGTFAAYLGAAEGGTLSQSLTTVAGSSYDLQFYIASTTINQAATPNALSISWNGTQIYSAANLPAFGYTLFLFPNLLATGAATLLEFDTTSVPADFVLDDVQVTETPEPAALAEIGAGLLALFAIGALRRRRAA